ncbi:hypothetical protein BVRB_3g052170 isoform B [Beta vulgaris subsp. vulgaris]|nr:hypothetical protein BVRB_3g052170 isoform B [Beta vulgaris subsp. vulgaris]
MKMFSGLAIVFVAENDYRFVRKFGRGICNRKVLAGGHCANNGISSGCINKYFVEVMHKII